MVELQLQKKLGPVTSRGWTLQLRQEKKVRAQLQVEGDIATKAKK